jgi:ligand-binding sensor domain-containing protein
MRIRGTLAPIPFVLCIFLTVLSGLASGNDAWHVTSWTTDDALPQGSVYAIHETADGYLWFTTLGGLVRYDGIEFTVFAKATTPGLRSNRFTTLFESTDGTLWAGTEDGFVTRYRDGSFTTYSVDGTVTPVSPSALTILHRHGYSRSTVSSSSTAPDSPGRGLRRSRSDSST